MAGLQRIPFLPPVAKLTLIGLDLFDVLPITDFVVDTIKWILKPGEMNQIQSDVQNRQLELMI